MPPLVLSFTQAHLCDTPVCNVSRDDCAISHKNHWETKGWFRKRVVLANVPSFRFSFRGNMRTYPRSGFRSGGTSKCIVIPVFVPGEHPPKLPFWKTTLLSTPEKKARNTFATLSLQVSRDMNEKYRCWASKAESCIGNVAHRQGERVRALW